MCVSGTQRGACWPRAFTIAINVMIRALYKLALLIDRIYMVRVPFIHKFNCLFVCLFVHSFIYFDYFYPARAARAG